MPLMRNVSIIKPAFPGGRFSGGALLGRALVSNVSNGSRRTTAFSAAGFSTGGLGGFPEAALVESLAVAGAFAGAFAGPLAFAGVDDFAAEAAGACGALGGWGSAGTCFITWPRTALGWTFWVPF